MKLAVVGTGYVGLVAGACFADTGNNVICVDIDKEKINNLNKSVIPIYEPGLEKIVKRNVSKERLVFTTDIKKGVQNSDIIFIAVGTPPDEDGSADLRHVLEVASSIGKYMNSSKIIVNKSTVPVGTGEKVKNKIEEVLKKRFSKIPPFTVASNPEFLKEGDAVNDFLKPERVIVGSDSEEAKELLHELYEPFTRRKERFIYMDLKSAELTKYAANSMLATRISFMNEISRLCEAVGADIEDIRRGIGSDSRIGNSFLFAGCGYGGSCFPKDVKALLKTGNDNNLEMNIIDAVERVNLCQKNILFNKLLKHFKDIKGKTFSILGLSFKPKTDDMREAPSRTLIKSILKSGGKIRAYDPVAMKEARRIFGENENIFYASNLYEAVSGTDAMFLVTEWMEFLRPDFDKIKSLMKTPVIFDGRNQYKPERIRKKGFIYHSIGRV
ncbi:MAG: UDP-glucose dehydrogenase family protein [Candidatus Muiribacteriota bacterium]